MRQKRLTVYDIRSFVRRLIAFQSKNGDKAKMAIFLFIYIRKATKGVTQPCRDFTANLQGFAGLRSGGTFSRDDLVFRMLLTEPILDSTRFNFSFHHPIMALDRVRAEDATWDENRRQLSMSQQAPAEDLKNGAAAPPSAFAQDEGGEVALPETSQSMSVLDRVGLTSPAFFCT